MAVKSCEPIVHSLAEAVASYGGYQSTIKKTLKLRNAAFRPDNGRISKSAGLSIVQCHAKLLKPQHLNE